MKIQLPYDRGIASIMNSPFVSIYMSDNIQFLSLHLKWFTITSRYIGEIKISGPNEFY